MPIVWLPVTMTLVAACMLAPSAYTLLSIFGKAPMTVPIFLAWLGWLQIVHLAAGVFIWRRRHLLSPRLKAAMLSWGGLAFWYWLPAPIYFLLTMNLDELQLKWTALAFFWEVPVVGGAFLIAAQRLYPSRRRLAKDAGRRYRAVMRYPTLVGSLLFVFTLLGYTIGALQLRVFASLPLVEQIKNVGHGIVISLLLAVFYYLGLDRVLEPVRSQVAREGGLGTVVARTVAGRIFGVSLAVAVSGFALIILFVLQAFQAMVADGAATMLMRDLAQLAQAPDTTRRLGPFVSWGEHGRLLLLRADEDLPAAEFSPETRRQVAHGGREVTIVRDTRRDLKVVGFVEAPRLGGRLVGVAFHVDAYGAFGSAGRLLAIAGAFVLTVTVGMLVFASRASTQAVRALSSAVRRTEAGQGGVVLRVDTGDEIGELSAVVERYVRRSRDLSENLQERVREKTQRLEALQHIDRSILAAESVEAIARAALPRLRQVVACRWGAILIFEHDVARIMVTDGEDAPAEGSVIPIADLPSSELLQTSGPRSIDDLADPRYRGSRVFQRLLEGGARSLVSAPLIASGDTIGLLCVARSQPATFDADHRQIVSEVANQLAVAIHQASLRQELDRQQERLQAVVQHLPDGVLLLEADGRIVITNAVGRTHIPAVATRAPGGAIAAVGDMTLAQLLAAPVPAREITVDGRRFFQVAAQRLEEGQGVVLVIRDVTREREAQQVTQQQARLAAVGQLAAGIAHDFNNILMTIVNSAELAQRRDGERDFRLGRLKIIIDQGEHAAALVRQILDFSRQSTPALETVNLGPLLEQMVDLLERTLPETIRIVVEPIGGEFIVDADPNQLSQVLTNLAVNARDAMPLGGELRFRLGRDVRAAADGDAAPGPGSWVTLVVSDTGAGMPPEVRERIFEPFFTTKAPGSGTGLGLSQVYGIVTQHRGHIAVDSRPGRGTTFTVYLPAGRGALGAADGPENAAMSGRGETLLLVEDEAPVRQSLAHILTDLNYRVLTAASAEQALELHEEHAEEVALVLTDLVMPGMGGLRLVRELRDRGVRAPVIMISGYVDDSARAGADGVSAWVQKPVRAGRLAAIIQEALASRVA
jgi:signal transduction histidine kinase/ActR/RegA family two-component response regulator/HAMP domain-containing protein